MLLGVSVRLLLQGPLFPRQSVRTPPDGVSTQIAAHLSECYWAVSSPQHGTATCVGYLIVFSDFSGFSPMHIETGGPHSSDAHVQADQMPMHRYSAPKGPACTVRRCGPEPMMMAPAAPHSRPTPSQWRGRGAGGGAGRALLVTLTCYTMLVWAICARVHTQHTHTH